MANSKIVLVHGMGQHTSDSFKKEFIEACDKALDLYPALADKSIEEFVDIESVGYNDIFDAERQQMADRATSLKDRLDNLNILENDVTKIISRMTRAESAISDDDFYKTHWLDVFFYRFTTLGEKVRIRVGQAITQAMADVNGSSQKVHVLGHSLGTAVVHDTLAKLYDENTSLGQLGNLDTASEKLGSLHLVANTSRVLESFVKVNRSLVKPGSGGCTSYYYDYRHAYDPITWPRSFDPTDNGSWIANDSWFRYQCSRLTSITNDHGNTHNIQHYIFNPLVHLKLFKKVCRIRLDDDEIKIGHDNYVDKTLEEVARKVETAIEKLKRKDLESVSGLIVAVKHLKEFVEQLGGQYHA